MQMARRQGVFNGGTRQGRADAVVRPHRPRRPPGLHSIVSDDSTAGQERRSARRRDEGGADKGRFRLVATSRGSTRPKAGDAKTTGSSVPQHRPPPQAIRRRCQQDCAAAVQGATPSRSCWVLVANDPDGTQHNTGDRLKNKHRMGETAKTSNSQNWHRRRPQQPGANAARALDDLASPLPTNS